MSGFEITPERIGFWGAMTALVGAVAYVVTPFLHARAPEAHRFWSSAGVAFAIIFLSLSTLIAVPLFEKRGLQRWVRRFFPANGLVIPLFCVAYFHPDYSVGQLLFGLPWGVTVPGSLLLLAPYFRRAAS